MLASKGILDEALAKLTDHESQLLKSQTIRDAAEASLGVYKRTGSGNGVEL